MEIKAITDSIRREELSRMAEEGFGDFVKAVVDSAQKIMAVGGEFHADEEVYLTENHGSKREHTWGINLYPAKPDVEWIQFDSMVNLKPALGNRSRGVENAEIREEIKKIIKKLVRG